MSRKIDLIGMKYGRLTVISNFNNKSSGHALWLCLCECGTEKVIRSDVIRLGKALSCGCFQKENMSFIKTTHGMSDSPEYGIWRQMIKRCTYNKYKDFHRYGGRGIKVSDRWLKFENFIEDMGRRPSVNHQIDRIDNNGNYQKGNCRWTSQENNAKNKSNSKWWYINEIRYDSIRSAAKQIGVCASSIRRRIENGVVGYRSVCKYEK